MNGDEPVLARLFRRAGYSTGAFTGGAWISKSFRFQKGFDHFNADGGKISAGIRWVEDHRDESWFLFFHTFSAHVPYTDTRFTADHEGGRFMSLLDPESREELPEYKAAWRGLKCGEMDATRAEREYVEALYDGGVGRADDLVATWLEAIDRLGLRERTAVIVLSDHGEEFWEHTGRGSSHGNTLYDEILRVPLIWVEPGTIAAGGTVTEPVSLIDVVPTIAARFGLVPPAISDGVDLSPLLDGGNWNVVRPIFAESIRDGATRVSVRTKRGKLIALTGPPKPRSGQTLCDPPVLPEVELFLLNDRSESDDRSGRAAGLERELHELIANHLRQAKTAAKDAPKTVLDTETEEALRRLGYIQ